LEERGRRGDRQLRSDPSMSAWSSLNHVREKGSSADLNPFPLTLSPFKLSVCPSPFPEIELEGEERGVLSLYPCSLIP
jgi:hypothetical protein